MKLYTGLLAIGMSIFTCVSAQTTAPKPVATDSVRTATLKGVTVESKRPLIEQRADRTIVNVDASISNVGVTALEVLEKSPGVTVDSEGNISLKGKSGVLILVDGRPTQLSGADLANLLKGMPSGQMDQVEIMTNPPARFDAAGGAGVINIKTKKLLKVGFNGSAGITYLQGRYPKTSETFNFNYREGKVNWFANLSHNYQKRFSDLSIRRNIRTGNSDEISQVFSQETNRIVEMNGYNAKVGVDFFATKKSTFGATISITDRNGKGHNPNRTEIAGADKVLQSITNARVENDIDWTGLNANLNFRRVLDKKGAELTADLDAASFRTKTDLFMSNAYLDANGNSAGHTDTLVGDLPQDINVYSARVDYFKPVGKKGKFEAGVKTSIVNTDNDARYDSILYGAVVPDLNRSNHFFYEENINAAFVNLERPLGKKFSAQLGLRLENTNARGRQKSTGENFDRHYTQLFPTAYVQYAADAKNTLNINYGRRIRRPAYGNLNPFIRFLDRYTFSRGNPNLKPSISDNIELSHTWKNSITTTLNYTFTDDVVQEIIRQNGNEASNIPENVASYRQFGISVAANMPLTKWWTNNTNLNLFNDDYSGTVPGAAIDLQATSFIFNTTQQFKLTKTFLAELTGFYRNGWLEGVLRVKSIWHLGAGLSKQVWNKKGTIRLSVRDIFWTQKLKARSRYGNVDLAMNQVSDTRIVSLGFNYSFSKGKKISPVKRSAGSMNEEQGRIGQ
ncbi:MAG: TonB-dependent receptor [Chitinophagaceae bacterium]|nr:MAG: TonB-dependent receptor [Chitinophagaceae bacterium]